VRLLVDTLHNQTIVPAVAIQRGQQGTFVYAIKPDNTVEVKTVQVGLMEGTDVTILSGLNVGETVVTDGSDRLQSGVKVRIRPPSSRRPGNGSNVESSGPGGGPPA
jgi:membrane fusion protein, multidrug efflux system